MGAAATVAVCALTGMSVDPSGHPAFAAPAQSSAVRALLGARLWLNSPGLGPQDVQGKVLLVNFWATWCHPCVQEMPALSDLQAKGKIANLQIIGIGIDTPEAIGQFSTKYKISYPLYIGGVGASELMRKYGDAAGGLPFSLLIGTDGQVKKTYMGALKIDEVKKDIKAL